MNRDFRDLLAEFNVQGVDFIIVGEHALVAHGCIRATQDLPVWIRPEAEMPNGFIAPYRHSERHYRISPKLTSQLPALFFRSALIPSASTSSLSSTCRIYPRLG